MSIQYVIAVNRFGLGARPGDLAGVSGDPKGWLNAQLDATAPTPAAFSELRPGREHAAALIGYFISRRQQRQSGGEASDPVKTFRESFIPVYQSEAAARVRAAVESEASFRERLVHFWSNHFTVSIEKRPIIALAGAFEREAIRPHVTGKFLDMLQAVETHPAMLTYLDNLQSIGPNSAIGRNGRRGLNENLAREILELHTLGVDGGYDQSDVTSFAKVITGWTVANGNRITGEPGTFRFVEPMHEPGAQTVVGKRYAEDGVEQGRAVLRDLARHPSTARFLATKLVRHFVSDDPAPADIDRLATTYLETDGDLAAVTRALVDLDTAWVDPEPKLKSPNDLVISGFRATMEVPSNQRILLGSFVVLQQQIWAAPSPAGWPDTAEHWASPDAVARRIEWATLLSERVPSRDPLQLADGVLGPALDDHTRLAIDRAASAKQGLALLLASPEFQRR